MQKYPQIIEYYEDIIYDIVVANISVGFFQNVFNTKTIQVCHTITIGIQSYPVVSCCLHHDLLRKPDPSYCLIIYFVNKHLWT